MTLLRDHQCNERAGADLGPGHDRRRHAVKRNPSEQTLGAREELSDMADR